MAKALMGAHVSPSSLRLLDEVRSLRQRVAELEEALKAAESARDAALERSEDHHERFESAVDVVDREPVRT